MRQRSWWAYIPEWCEEGVVVDAYTLGEAIELASVALLEKDWTEGIPSEWVRDVVTDTFYIYELGPLHECEFIIKEEE